MPFIYYLQEANESGALRLAKNKLEKQLEDLTWRLHLEKRIRVFVSSVQIVHSNDSCSTGNEVSNDCTLFLKKLFKGSTLV